MSANTSYSVRRARFPEDRQMLVDLWKGNLGDPDKLDRKYEWFYERSPTGEPLAMVLEFDDGVLEAGRRPVGVAAAGPRAFHVNKEPLDAAVLVDMAVVKQHRTLYPALLLQKTLLAEALVLTPLLYGFPNIKAAPVFQRAGYRKLGMFVRHVRVLRAAEYLVDSLPRWLANLIGRGWDLLVWLFVRCRYLGAEKLSLHWLDVKEAVADSPPLPDSDASLVRGARSDEFLRWRFMSDRSHAYRFVSVSGESVTGSAGYWIVEDDGAVLHVRDCSPSLLASATVGRAWMLLFEEARRRGFSSVSFECLAPDKFVRTLKHNGMTTRSERPVFVAVRDDHVSKINSSDWYLTDADEDE